MKPEVLALIPARGDSKGIPRKNLLDVGGKPLIAYSIAQALASRHITRTIVSTDDGEIAEAARRCGAEVPFLRPEVLAQDLSTDLEVFRHALEWLRDHEHYTCDLVVHLRPTAPVRRVPLIEQAIETMLGDPEADSLRAVSRPEQTPFKMWRIVDGCLEPIVTVPGVADAHSLPRQQLPEVFWQNGYVDIVRPRTVLDLGSMAGRRILPFVIDDPVPELDYPEDVPNLAAAMYALERGEWPGNLVSPAKRLPI